MRYESVVEVESQAVPGTRLTIRKMSFDGRTELARQIREIASQMEFLEAGDAKEKMSAALIGREVERAYLRWGLLKVTGLDVDGAPATPASLLQAGPEALVQEALEAIQSQCGLLEEERKN